MLALLQGVIAFQPTILFDSPFWSLDSFTGRGTGNVIETFIFLFNYFYIYLSVIELVYNFWTIGWRIKPLVDCLFLENNFYSHIKNSFQKAVLREHSIKNNCCSSYFWYSICPTSVTYHFTCNVNIAESLKSLLSIKE